MHRASWNVDEIPWLSVDRLRARLERGAAFQDIEGLVFIVVKVGGRTTSGCDDPLHYKAASVGLRACDEEAYAVAWAAVHRAGARWDICDWSLVLHGGGSLGLSCLSDYSGRTSGRNPKAHPLTTP